MQLNTELTGMLEELGSLLLKVGVKEHFNSNEAITISVKTPNIFYKKYYVFLHTENESEDLTSKFSEDDLKTLKNIMGQVYFNYFFHYSKQFSSKYYTILYKLETGTYLIPEEALETNTL